MSGAYVEFRGSAQLQAMLGRLADDDLSLALKDIGEHLLRSTRQRAAQEIDAEGNPWVALSPRYLRRKQKRRPGAPKLKHDNHMLGDQLSHQVVGNTVLVGTSAKYGAIHQFGGTIQRKARDVSLYYYHYRDGRVGNRFVKKGRSNFAQTAHIGEHSFHIPARPFLGVSREDESEILQLAREHLERVLTRLDK